MSEYILTVTEFVCNTSCIRIVAKDRTEAEKYAKELYANGEIQLDCCEPPVVKITAESAEESEPIYKKLSTYYADNKARYERY